MRYPVDSIVTITMEVYGTDKYDFVGDADMEVCITPLPGWEIYLVEKDGQTIYRTRRETP